MEILSGKQPAVSSYYVIPTLFGLIASIVVISKIAKRVLDREKKKE